MQIMIKPVLVDQTQTKHSNYDNKVTLGAKGIKGAHDFKALKAQEFTRIDDDISVRKIDITKSEFASMRNDPIMTSRHEGGKAASINGSKDRFRKSD